MTNVTHIHRNQLAESLRSLARMADEGKITFIEGLVQQDDGDFVEWKLIKEGDKSFDQAHLITQLGYHDLIKQSIIEDLLELIIED